MAPAPRRGTSAVAGRASRLGLALGALVLTAGVVLAGCGGGSGPEVKLSAAGERGHQLARDKGCTACHTANGKRSTGPTWQGLAGSRVELDDGSKVTADDAYLRRAIVDPRAQVVDGYPNIMPTAYRDLSAAEVDSIVAYINDLAG